jgi:hypothetical protein
MYHCWRILYWYQHVSAGQIGAGTNVPVQYKAGTGQIGAGTNVPVQYKAGTLVPVRNTSRH